MKVLIILGAVLLALVLLALVRFGAAVEYNAAGVQVRVKLGPLRLRVWPLKPKKWSAERKPRRKKSKEAPLPKGKPDLGGSLALVRQCLPLVARAAGRLLHKIRIDRFELEVTAAAPDPAAAALAFGGANAAVGMIWPLVEQNFHVKERDIRTRVDFEAQAPTVRLKAEVTLTIGQAVHVTAALGVGLLGRYLEYRRTHPREKPSDKTQKEAV